VQREYVLKQKDTHYRWKGHT